MGIFGSRKKVYVSSVVYNLAGDEFKRPDYLKTTVVSSTLNNAPSLADSITDSYLDGPGMKFRRFHQWADRTEYNDLIGLVTGSIQTGDSINVPALIAEIPGAASLQSASIAAADYTFWVDQHVLENFPHLVDTSYTADIDGVTNDITITWADGSEQRSFSVEVMSFQTPRDGQNCPIPMMVSVRSMVCGNARRTWVCCQVARRRTRLPRRCIRTQWLVWNRIESIRKTPGMLPSRP
jgi:hypothetical protein